MDGGVAAVDLYLALCLLAAGVFGAVVVAAWAVLASLWGWAVRD